MDQNNFGSAMQNSDNKTISDQQYAVFMDQNNFGSAMQYSRNYWTLQIVAKNQI